MSTYQKDDSHSLNDGQDQQDPACSSSHQHALKVPCDADDKGVHIYVYPEDGFSKHGEESEEEVMMLQWIAHSVN